METNNEMGGATFAQDEADEEYSQNQLLQSEAKAEWLNQTIKIIVAIENGQSLEKKYALEDGQTPEAVAIGIQEMTDELLDLSEI